MFDCRRILGLITNPQLSFMQEKGVGLPNDPLEKGDSTLCPRWSLNILYSHQFNVRYERPKKHLLGQIHTYMHTYIYIYIYIYLHNIYIYICACVCVLSSILNVFWCSLFLHEHLISKMLSLQFTQVRYSYARDRAVGFSEFWRPLKWSEAEWERRYLAFSIG